MLLGSRNHTLSDTRRWVIDYSRWLDNTVHVQTATVTSSSTTCTIKSNMTEGDTVVFFLTGGVLGETCTVTIQIVDTNGNTKTDTLAFTVVAA